MATTAVLLANLGSPDSCEVKDLRKYLGEFLMDERVIDIPYVLRAILVKGIIVPFRSPKSAVKYKTIWTENGSPLIHISKQVQTKLHQKLDIPVELCMRYGNPTPAAALERLTTENPELKELVFVPLYPHYAMSSYETAVEQVKQIHREKKYGFNIRIVPPFYNHPGYIRTLANSIRPYLERRYDHILFSYHGIPERHVRKTDASGSHCLATPECCQGVSVSHKTCYRHQVHETTRLTAAALGLQEKSFSTSFQSRLGTDAWLKPYTVEQLMKFPKQGVRKLLVLCPAFVSDCLETLEEVRVEGRDIFMGNGGVEFDVVPCLNDRTEWIENLSELVKREMSSPQLVKA